MTSELTELVVCALMAGAMMWIIGKYLDIFLVKKATNKITGFLWGLFFVYQFIAEYGKGSGSVYMLLLNAILIFMLSLAGYEGNVWTKLFHTILICALGALIEMVAYFCLQFLLPSHTDVFNSFGSVLSKLLSVVLIILLNIKLGSPSDKRLPTKYIAIMLVIPVASIFIANDIFLLDNEVGSVRSMLSFSLLLVINCFIFEICQKLYENMETEHENAIFAQQLELVSQHTEEQKQLYEKQREFRHNLKNYCIALRVNIEGDDKREALNMVDQMLLQEQPGESVVATTGNDLIDALINYKYGIAKKYGITVEAELYVPMTISKIAYGDLSIILGNLLDNAIEAARECSQKRKINIDMKMKRKNLIINIRNTYEKAPNRNKQGDFVTGKEDFENHGFGIKSVKRAVDKYAGSIIFEVKDGTFEVMVIIGLE